jgi:hypothetical protein
VNRAAVARLREAIKSNNPFKVADTNHIQLRSAGGPDETWNLVTLSRLEHDQFHLRDPRVALRIEGNADETLTFTTINRETGRVIQSWPSPNPSASQTHD